jgi:hexosaminidase
MKLILLFAFVFVFGSVVFGETAAFNIIPRPASIKAGSGEFNFDQKTKIVAEGDAGRKAAGILNDLLMANYGFKLEYTDKDVSGNAIKFFDQAVRSNDPRMGEAYTLKISKDAIEIFGTENGMFYGIQTLMQILPVKYAGAVKIPSAEINDTPRFQYRGMHLDVSRHFMPVSFVKKFIDLMSQYKLNTFHWHLTDDQGWRIEIKKYPKPTEIGSTRPETLVGRYTSVFKGDGIPHGGFYTQEEIKDVVAYAKKHFITVIPEIELPGHASAALAAYPEFGCKTDYTYKVQMTWGIFKETYCPTDATFKFLEDVLDETMALFPDSPYIHIGGDEVLKDHWKESAFVQELMKRENLKDEHEVQSYFVRRIEKYINSKGKKIIGWDEILEGGLAPNATVMSWRGMKGGIEAARSKHDVIMTPTDYVYLDYGQGDPAYEPLNIGSYVPLAKVYSFEPVPPELSADEAKYIIGAQANLWTEYIPEPSQAEYMYFPRMLALAEVVWSPKEGKDFADFQKRLQANLPRLDKQNVNYRIPEPEGLQNVLTDKRSVSIELKPAAGTKVFYTTDGSTPTERSTRYTKPIVFELTDGEVATLKTIVVNAIGRASSVYAATIVQGKMFEADATNAAAPGVNYKFFVPRGDMSGEGEEKSGETKSIMLNQFAKEFDLKKDFSVTFDGYLKITEDGIYELQVDSTWDATVIFGGEKVIDAEGTKDSSIKRAILPLKAGLHKISLRYNHRGGEANFRFRYGLKGQGLRQAYGGEFVH